MLSDSIAADSRDDFFRGGLMAWIVCLSAGLFFFYEFFQLNLFDVMNQSLRVEFHLNATQLSWMSSAYLWANILFLLPAGVILDRFSTRLVILSAMLVCIVGTVGFALTNSYALATFYHSLSGLGNAFCFVSCVVLTSRWFPPRRQALVIGCVITMAFIGGMVAHTPFAYLNDHYGWRYSLLIDGFIGVLLFFWIMFFVKDTPDEGIVMLGATRASESSRLLQVLTNRQNWLSGLYTSCLNLPILVICALWGASYLQVVHHVPQMTASNIVSLIFIGSIFGCPLAGWLSDQSGRRRPLMIIGGVATLLTMIPLFTGIALSEPLLSILFFALGLFTSTQVITYPLIAESNRTCNTGVATGIASVIIMGGGGVGQVLFGWLMQHHAGVATQQYSITDFQFAMWMFPITTIIALVASFFIRETFCEPIQK